MAEVAMNVESALAQADAGQKEGLLGAYPVAAMILANEVRRLRAAVYLAVMDERNACIGICAKYRGADGDDIASEIEARMPPDTRAK
jgi:hypothetical protein